MKMPSFSDRQHDAFDNPAKALGRDGNLRVLREAAHLLSEDPPHPLSHEGRGEKIRLRCDWCELMGATGLLTLDMLKGEAVLAARVMIGIQPDLESTHWPMCSAVYWVAKVGSMNLRTSSAVN